MWTVLIDSPPVLATAIVSVALLNYFVALSIVRAHSRQDFVERDNWRPPGLAGKTRTDAAQLALPFPGIVAVIVLLWFMDRFWREVVGGGELVQELATLGLNVGDLLLWQSLRVAGSAEGHICYSAAHRYRSGAGRLIGMSILLAALAALFANYAFLFAAFMIGATALGWRRRAYQASQGPQR
jgi:hypothetical protein